jgi:hypothetical protein
MRSFEKSDFFNLLLPLSLKFQGFWKNEVPQQWNESRTFLKALMADYDSFKEFTDCFGSEMSPARTSATLGYLDQFEVLNPKFSTFTEFGIALALTLSNNDLKNRSKRRLLSAICRLDFALSTSVFSNDKEWHLISDFVEKDLSFLFDNLNELHPSFGSVHQNKERPKLKAA